MSPSTLPVIIVTGASRGIGLSTVQYLLTSSVLNSPAVPKCNVVTLSRSLPDGLSSLLKDHKEQLECVQGDVLDENVHQRLVDKAMDRWGRLDGVVLNAGVIEFGTVAEGKPSSFAQQIAINLTSLFTTLHYALPQLRTSPTGLGRVVFVSSGAAVGNYAAWAPYNASKAGLNALARTVANEEKGKVAVFSIRPGVVDTEMQAQIRDHGTQMGMDDAAVDKFTQMYKKGELVKQEDPSHVLAALVTKGGLEEPKTKEGKGAGREGAFLSWDEELLKEYRRA